MRRVLFASLSLLALAWMSGCSNASSGSAVANTTPSPSGLSGQFGFVLSGFDPVNPIVIAGSFTANGSGQITAGDVDVNDNGVHSTASAAITGSYAFDSLPAGTIGLGALGTMVFTNAVGTVAQPLKFAFALNSTGTFGTIIDISANSFVVAGTMQKQSALTLASLAGGYVVTFNGKSQSSPASAIGRLTLGSTGTVTAASFDRSISGVGTAGPNTTATIGAFSAPDGNGRGTFTINLADALQTTPTQTFAYYGISASRFIAAETDANGTMIVDAESQGTILASPATTGSVFGMAGFDTATTSEISAVGQVVIPGSLTLGTIADDSNDNGAINTNAALAVPTVTYNAATGRGTATVTNGLSSGFPNSLVFYLTGTTGGISFIMDSTTGASNRAMSGPFTVQTGVGVFSTATDLAGNGGIVRGKGLALNDADAFIAQFELTSTAGEYALVADQRVPTSSGSTTVSTSTDGAIAPIAVGGLSASTGRGTLLNGAETLAFYVIAPNQFVFIDISAVGSGFNGASPLFLTTPD